VPEEFESIRCEAYGPGGAALIVDCRTDSRDRTIARVRQVVLAHGGYPGARGAVSYLFNEVGRLVFAPGTDAARLAGVAVQAGAEDVIVAGATRPSLEVLTDPIDFDTVRGALQAAGFLMLARTHPWAAAFAAAVLAYFLLINGPVATPRYRLPMEPVLLVLTAIPLARLVEARRASAPSAEAGKAYST